MREIINAIWNLPWYKILVVAVADDVILFLKLWPLWIVAFILLILMTIWINNLG